MSSKTRPLIGLATVALISAGGSYGFAASGTTGKTSIPRPVGPTAPGNPSAVRSSRQVRSRLSLAPGRLPALRSSPSVTPESVPTSAAPGTLPR